MVLTKGKLGAFGSQATRLRSGTLLLLLLLVVYSTGTGTGTGTWPRFK